ncbi:helix-turn-helix domain-containing protein [uncultured Bifidobacterium sp.]|uniref:helix-turn-helix domain-containing protein n=1 Tax=uncultured Bifidobacterium sp. TaxID=165187 RepID=UPI0025F80937|nr:helix-turn-helix domain-containing protein [uncultured Bifidobacterium sp.]
MSWQATNWALREAPVGGDTTARLILVALADRAHPDGSASWPSVRTLMRELHVSERTIRRKLSLLESGGLIRRGNQELSRRDEQGRLIPGQYRPVVWDLCMGAEPEPVSEAPEPRGANLAPLPEGRNEDDSRGDVLAPLAEAREARGATGGRPGVPPVAGKPSNKPLPPLSPKGDISPREDAPSNGHLLQTGMAALLAGQDLPVPADSRRERRAARRLAARHEVGECLDLARWALEDPEGFWRPVIISCKALEKHWDQLTLQRERSRKACKADAPGAAPVDGHAPSTVASGRAGIVTVYGGHKWSVETNRRHVEGEVSEDSCPCCAWDERNRPLHGLGQRVKPAPSSKRKPSAQPVHHFIGAAS